MHELRPASESCWSVIELDRVRVDSLGVSHLIHGRFRSQESHESLLVSAHSYKRSALSSSIALIWIFINRLGPILLPWPMRPNHHHCLLPSHHHSQRAMGKLLHRFHEKRRTLDRYRRSMQVHRRCQWTPREHLPLSHPGPHRLNRPTCQRTCPPPTGKHGRGRGSFNSSAAAAGKGGTGCAGDSGHGRPLSQGKHSGASLK